MTPFDFNNGGLYNDDDDYVFTEAFYDEAITPMTSESLVR